MKFLTALFFFSGFSALLYQVVWQRILTLFSGVDAQSVAITVAAYMLGMGTGSMCGGFLSEKISKKQSVVCFALAELFIAGFALSSKFILYDTLYLQWSNLARSQTTLAVAAFSILLIPTFCMGVTLPLLSRAVTAQRNQVSTAIGILYGINTLGAAFGAVGAALLIRYVGMVTAVSVGALINFTCAAAAMILLKQITAVSSQSGEAASINDSEPDARSLPAKQLPLAFWVVSYFISGYISLTLELIWFRVLGVMLKPTGLTFAWLLLLFLGGIAIGSFAGIYLARRLKNPITGFLLAQAGTPLYSGIALPVLLFALERCPLFAQAWSYMGADSPMPFNAHISDQFVQLYVVAASFLIVPPTILMGISFPLLQKAVQTEVEHVGFKVGLLQTANIVGAVLGSLLMGMTLFSTLGVGGSLRWVVLCSAWSLFFWCHFQFRGAGTVRLVTAYFVTAVVFVAVAAGVPTGEKLLASLHGTNQNSIIVKEDCSGVAALKPLQGSDFNKGIVVLTNGQGQSKFPYSTELIHVDIGLLASILHPHPVDVGVIGLGSGETAYAAAGRAETKSVDCIEVIGGEIDNLKELQKRRTDPALTALMSDPRMHFQIADGRRFIQLGEKRYDVLEADAMLPFGAYAGNLYSEEFFRLLGSKLKPAGIAISWFPTERTKRSFSNVFPYVCEFEGIGVGSFAPILSDNDALLARASEPFLVTHFKRANYDSHSSMVRLLKSRLIVQSSLPVEKYKNINSDLFPRDEFRTPESPGL